jgi:hypothetical protein
MNSQPAPVNHDNENQDKKPTKKTTMVHYITGFIVLFLIVILLNHVFGPHSQSVQYGGGPILDSAYSPDNLSEVPTIYSLME